jgi:hypothetical protein
MAGAALNNHGTGYEKNGVRKPPTAETDRRPPWSGPVCPLPNLCPHTVAEVAKSIPNTIALRPLPAASERLLNVRDRSRAWGLGTLQNFIGLQIARLWELAV